MMESFLTEQDENGRKLRRRLFELIQSRLAAPKKPRIERPLLQFSLEEKQRYAQENRDKARLRRQQVSEG
jgi:hypothetical protein